VGGRVLIIAALLASSWSVAHGHVAPSTSTNNRYIKLTPMGDRVRLAYTVYMGEVPGAQARRRMDANKDRSIDEKEADAYGKQVAEAVKGALVVTVDGVAHRVVWSQIHVGLGTPVASAGAFSIDMIAWFCLAQPSKRRPHTLQFRDEFRLPKPGEVELRIDESPGVAVTEARIGDIAKKPQLAYQWTGKPRPLATVPFQLGFKVAADAVFSPDAVCPLKAAGAPDKAKATGEKGSGLGATLAMILGALVLIGMAVWAVKKQAI
jgi:hypothetical protein